MWNSCCGGTKRRSQKVSYKTYHTLTTPDMTKSPNDNLSKTPPPPTLAKKSPPIINYLSRPLSHANFISQGPSREELEDPSDDMDLITSSSLSRSVSRIFPDPNSGDLGDLTYNHQTLELTEQSVNNVDEMMSHEDR